MQLRTHFFGDLVMHRLSTRLWITLVQSSYPQLWITLWKTPHHHGVRLCRLCAHGGVITQPCIHSEAFFPAEITQLFWGYQQARKGRWGEGRPALSARKPRDFGISSLRRDSGELGVSMAGGCNSFRGHRYSETTSSLGKRIVTVWQEWCGCVVSACHHPVVVLCP